MVMYVAYDLGRTLSRPLHTWASMMQSFWSNPVNPWASLPGVKMMAASSELLARATADYPKPAFGLLETIVDGAAVRVREQVVHNSPFCRLVHFERDVVRNDPKVLIVAPLSGHHATLLRETVRELLPDHDLYITDWLDARLVPLSAGAFGLADYADLVIEQLRLLGADTHVLSICQPAVPTLIAVARLAEQDDAAQPRSMILVAGPVDTRVNPSSVGRFAQRSPLAALEATVIHRVPFGHTGAGRRVYPGILQLMSFMSLDPQRHVDAHRDLFGDIVKGNSASADKRRKFYDEYFAVMDLPAEFYLETVDHVFRRHSIAKGEMLHRGTPVRLETIERTALLTIEGDQDDITTPGQTFAAHALLTGIPESRKQHYLQEGAGHYGTFSGQRFRQHIAPRIREFVRTHV